MEQADGLDDLRGEVQRKLGSDDPSNSKMSVVEDEFNRLIEDGKEEEALNYLAEQNDVIQKSKNVSTEGMVKELVQETIDKRERQAELTDRNKGNTREIEIAKTRKVELESKLPNAKKKEAARIKEELAELDITVNLFGDERKYNQDEIVAINGEIAVLDLQVDVIQSSGASVLKEIDKRNLEDAQAAIRAQEANDRAEELSSEIAQIESDNPQISDTDPIISTVSETDKLIDAHTAAVQQIELAEDCLCESGCSAGSATRNRDR